MIEGLLFDEARAFISNLETTEIENWWAWKEEWPDWRQVTEFEGLTEMIYRPLHVSPPPPPRETEEQSIEVDKEELVIVDTFGNSRVSATDPGARSDGQFMERSKKRYRKRYQVTVLGKDKTFQTHTRDISVGGINVEDELPVWVNGLFQVRIMKPNSRQVVELTCSFLEGAGADRHRLIIMPLESEEDERNLDHWLAA